MISSRICAPVLPIALPMRPAASTPRLPNSIRSVAVIFADDLIFDIVSTRPAISAFDPPDAATAFCSASRYGMTFFVSIPNASICCCALMNVAFENGDLRANSSSLSICSFAAFADPSIVVNAARDFCCNVL